MALINKNAPSISLCKLRMNAKLEHAARSHSTDMGENQYFGHDSLERRDMESR